MTCKIRTNVYFLKLSCSFQQLNNVMTEVQEIEWEKCCVCDGEKKGDLRSTTKGIMALEGQFLEFWKNGLLPFDPAKIRTNYTVGEHGTEHPDLEHVMPRKSAKYHYNCHIRYSPYNFGRKKKLLQNKNKKAEVGQSYYKIKTRKLKWGSLVPLYVHLWAPILVHLQVQHFQILFALYTMKMMPLRTFMLLGHFMRLNQN